MKQNIKIKLCGINTVEILNYCCNLAYKPNYLGFVFYANSPRNITYSQAERFKKIIGKKIPKIAVTVNSSLEDMDRIMSSLHPDYLQFHGEESVTYIQTLKDQFNIKVIKAIAIKEDLGKEKISYYENYVDYFLFDSATKEYGGSGVKFNWGILNGQNIKKPWFLSGGINASNILSAIESSNTNLFDISSGIESAKGVKDKNKIYELLNLIKNETT